MGNCIVVVQFDLPKRTEEQAIKGGTGTAPVYRDLGRKGLIRKDYLNGEAGTGGVYLWESRAAAEAWFTEERMADLTKRFGARPRLTWYDTCAFRRLRPLIPVDRDHLFRSIATSVTRVLVAPLDVAVDVSLPRVGQARQEAVPVVNRRDPRAPRSALTADAAARVGGPC